jgi:hypothetical protein
LTSKGLRKNRKIDKVRLADLDQAPSRTSQELALDRTRKMPIVMGIFRNDRFHDVKYPHMATGIVVVVVDTAL